MGILQHSLAFVHIINQIPCVVALLGSVQPKLELPQVFPQTLASGQL